MRDSAAKPGVRREHQLRIRDIGMFAFVAYLTLCAGLRPWYMRWGSTDKELSVFLPGDEFAAEPLRYGIQHAVTINASPDAVWSWLVQIGNGTTRLIARTRGGGETAPTDLALGPAGLLLFEVPHFVMQRRMLLGIKALAEGSHRS